MSKSFRWKVGVNVVHKIKLDFQFYKLIEQKKPNPWIWLKVLIINIVPKAGIEPALCCQNWILNPARLPIPPLRHGSILLFAFQKGIK